MFCFLINKARTGSLVLHSYSENDEFSKPTKYSLHFCFQRVFSVKREQRCCGVTFCESTTQLIQEVLACPSWKLGAWAILVHIEKKKKVNILSKKRFERVSRVWIHYLGTCVCVFVGGWLSMPFLVVSTNVAIFVTYVCVCPWQGPLNKVSLHQVFISSLVRCSSIQRKA